MRLLPPLAAASLLLMLAGCAVGFDRYGQPILGINVGPPDAETAAGAGKLASTALTFLGIPAPVATGIGGAITLGMGLWGSRAQAKASRLEGHAQGWDERERSPQPLPTTPPYIGA